MTVKRAWMALRYDKHPCFADGLRRLGYEVINTPTDRPGDNDILCTWNRIAYGDHCARIFSDLGLPVIVAENSTWGNDFAGGRWYSLGLDFHNVAGKFPIGSNDRWDSLNVELAPFREEGETVILPSRSIGPPIHRMPSDFVQRMRAQYAHARVRPHPGTGQAKPLADDLKKCGRVVTWGSGAAVKALMLGCRVDSYMPNWVGECESTESDRLRMLRDLAWGQARVNEIESGEAFVRLLATRH
jgi:hypothetical protein